MKTETLLLLVVLAVALLGRRKGDVSDSYNKQLAINTEIKLELAKLRAELQDTQEALRALVKVS